MRSRIINQRRLPAESAAGIDGNVAEALQQPEASESFAGEKDSIGWFHRRLDEAIDWALTLKPDVFRPASDFNHPYLWQRYLSAATNPAFYALRTAAIGMLPTAIVKEIVDFRRGHFSTHERPEYYAWTSYANSVINNVVRIALGGSIKPSIGYVDFSDPLSACRTIGSLGLFGYSLFSLADLGVRSVWMFVYPRKPFGVLSFETAHFFVNKVRARKRMLEQEGNDVSSMPLNYDFRVRLNRKAKQMIENDQHQRSQMGDGYSESGTAPNLPGSENPGQGIPYGKGGSGFPS